MRPYLAAMGKYAVFAGRSPRSDYWCLFLAFWIAPVIAAALDGVDRLSDGVAVVVGLWMLAHVSPLLAASVRRLHDTDRSAGWLFLSFVPFGGFVLLIIYGLRGTEGPNEYGPDPIAPAAFGERPSPVLRA